jgi:hypothetical protein
MARCGKICFPTRSAAETAMRSVPAKGVSMRAPTRAYWCGRCKAWHYTSRIRFSQRKRH